MRDIRSDLQERATLIEEQIRAAYAHFEKIFEQVQNERDARIANLQSGLAMIAYRAPTTPRPITSPPVSPQLLATDLPNKDDPRAELTQAEFLARAWRLANDKARELGWIA